MKASKYGFVQRLFKENFGVAGGVIDEGEAKRGRGAQFLTVGAQHKEQLASLMNVLFLTNPHFVRCILPNNEQKPALLRDKVVLDQLRCNGVLEGIRITRKGFPNRVIYADFLKRYYLLGKGVARATPDTKATVQILMDQLKVPKDRYQMGLTKIFFRTGQLAEIEEWREKKISEMIVSIQASSRALLGRRNFLVLKQKTIAATVIQANIRAWMEFKNWPWWKLFQRARPLLKRVNIEATLKEKEKELGSLKDQITTEGKAKAQLQAALNEAQSALGDLNNQLKVSLFAHAIPLNIFRQPRKT